MAIKVYGSMVSTATIRVLLCLTEKDLDFELIKVELLAGEHKQPHIVARNPFGQIPAFEDGDVNLFESRAICQYIAEAYADQGTELISKDPKTKAIQLVWMEVESQKFETGLSKLVWELSMKRVLFGQKGDETIVKEGEKVLKSLLDVYEARLSESKYLGGDGYSMADLRHVPMFKYLMDTEMKEAVEARPKVSSWVSNILNRPASVKVVGAPDGLSKMVL